MLRSVKYGLYGAVLAGLVGGTVAWTSLDKTVHLFVDGHEQSVHTTAANVGDILDGAGYHIGAHDLVAPSAGSHVGDGGTIVFKRGRLLRLDVDGADRLVWTTAPTVARALDQLGFSTASFTSVSRSRRLPLGATDITLRTPKQVTVVHDGTVTKVISTDPTVGRLLDDIAVRVDADDRVSLPAWTPLTDGETVTVQRVVHTTLTTTLQLPFRRTSRQDASLAAGTTRLAPAGRAGLAKILWAVVYVDGKLIGKTKVRTVIERHPVTRVRVIGTEQPKPKPKPKPKPAPVRSGGGGGGGGGGGSRPPTRPRPSPPPRGPAPAPGSARAIARSMLADFGWATSQFGCLDNIWSRESGWRVNAASPSGAYGIPQALPGSKMASAGPDWQTSAATQIKWGLGYISARYNSPCGAWSFWQAHGFY